MHPFLDPKTLDDDTLRKKILELQNRLRFVHVMSGNQQMVDQFMLLLDSLEEERQERLHREMKELWDKQFPDVIESDPEFTQSKKPAVPAAPNGKPPIERPKVAPVFNKVFKKK